MTKIRSRRARLMVLVASALLCVQVHAQHAVELDIVSQPLSEALRELGTVSNTNIIFEPAMVKGVVAPALKGSITREEALTRLLAGTKWSFKFVDENTVSLVPGDSKAAGAPASLRTSPDSQSSSSTVVESGGEGLRLAQSDNSNTSEGKKAKPRSSDSSPSRAESQAEDKSRIQEITVTAQKREERVQDVPMSIAVVSNEDIERRGLVGMEDYLRGIPGVNQVDSGPTSNSIVIRGITTSLDFENVFAGTTVATYFDETPITGAAGLYSGGIDVRPVDMERIEVLRGPQGTTFGNSSLGGAMRLIPARPKLDAFGAKLATAYSNTSRFGGDNTMIQGVVNIPLVTDKLAVRVVGYRYDDSGYLRNIAGIDPATIALADSRGFDVRGYVRDDIGRIRSTGGRFAALWQATDKLDLSLNLLTQKIEMNGYPAADIGTYEQVQFPVDPEWRVRGQVGDAADTNIDLASLVLKYNLDWAELTSVVSWVDGGSAYADDLTESFGYPASGYGPSDFNSFTAETRLASQLEGRWKFLGGLFYENVESHGFFSYPYLGSPETNPLSTDPLGIYDNRRKLDQQAFFGEVSYDLTDKLTATAGARYFKYRHDTRLLVEGAFGGVPFGAGVPNHLSSDENNSSFKANLSYKPTRDALLYASWTEGFRLGRPQTGADLTCDLDNDGIVDGTSISVESTKIVNSDFLESYEIGSKFKLFESRLLFDAAIYHINWDGLPVTQPLPCASATWVANAGKATSDGVELQASLYLVEGLRLDFGGAYNKAQLAEDVPAQGWRDGDRTPGSPKVSANFAAQYDFAVGGHKAFVRADSFYTGEFFGDLKQSPITEAGGYIKVDARAGVTFQKLNVELFVRNLTNEDAFTWRGAFNRNPFGGFRMRPRTVGIQLGYSFE